MFDANHEPDSNVRRCPKHSYPRTTTEWWELFDANHERLRSLVSAYHPGMRGRPGRRVPITAPAAERACERIRVDIAKDDGDPLVRFDAAAAARDGGTIVVLLNQTWFGVPEYGLLADPRVRRAVRSVLGELPHRG